MTISDFKLLLSDTVRKEINYYAPPTKENNTPKYYTTKEVSSTLGIAEITIHKMKKRGVLKGTYFGRSLRYSEVEIQKLIKSKDKTI